jgi:hypothetical protein
MTAADCCFRRTFLLKNVICVVSIAELMIADMEESTGRVWRYIGPLVEGV